jgi:hypothetical protein
MNAGTRASVTSMNAPSADEPGFKRQVVFRVGAADWAILRDAAAAHGSIQAALTAAIRALSRRTDQNAQEPNGQPAASASPPAEQSGEPAADPDVPGESLDEEILAREAAEILGLKTGTIRGYINSGRLAGRYDAAPDWRGWVTTRRAVTEYAGSRS